KLKPPEIATLLHDLRAFSTYILVLAGLNSSCGGIKISPLPTRVTFCMSLFVLFITEITFDLILDTYVLLLAGLNSKNTGSGIAILSVTLFDKSITDTVLDPL